MPGDSLLLHATSVSYLKYAALLRGPSASGKSDLAYRYINLPCNMNAHPGADPAAAREKVHQLVSDDQVKLERRGNRIFAEPPRSIAGKIELRGIGIVELSYIERAELILIIDLQSTTPLERMPDWTRTEQILGLDLPKLDLSPFEASAPLKLRAAFEYLLENPVS